MRRRTKSSGENTMARVPSFQILFRAELERAVGALGEPVLCDRRARDVPGEPLELATVAPVDDLTSVDVDAAHFGDRIGGIVGRRFCVDRHDETERRKALAVTGDGDASSGGGVAGGEPGLLVAKLGRLGVCHFGVERAAARAEDFLDARGGAGGHVGDLGACRRTERVEDEATTHVVADVHAVERQNVEMYVQSQS